MCAKQHPGTDEERKKVYENFDQQHFNWHIWGLMALGFFANSYSLCSMRVVLPFIAFSNWKRDDINSNALKINTAILTGSIIGKLLFGYLADRCGRLKFFGGQFFFLTFLLLFYAQSSFGYNSMPMIRLLMTWGFFAGICNGAGQSVAAAITVESAPVESRARRLATVFLMQYLSQFAVSAMSLLIIFAVDRSRDVALENYHAVGFSVADYMWRLVVASGAVFAFITFLVQFRVPKSPRYPLEVDKDYFSHSKSSRVENIATLNEMPLTDASNTSTINDLELIHMQHAPKLEPFSYNNIKEYFWARGNWRRLAGTSICWFLFGIVYPGLGISDPLAVAQFWTPPSLANSMLNFSGRDNPVQLLMSIYEAVMHDSAPMITIISAWSLLGSIILVAFIYYIPLKKMLAWSFLGLAVLFAIASGILSDAAHVNLQHWKFAVYILYQILCNIGPNALLFIVSTGIFPTYYRATCHGISASFGTFGSLLVMLCVNLGDLNAVGLQWMLIGSSIFMASGAAFTWVWIPEVQGSESMGNGRKMPSKTLDDLGAGNIGVKAKEI